MEDLSKNSELINNYLRGRMSKEEQRSFEIEINKNQALSEEVEKVRLEIDMMEYILAEDLRKKFARPTSPLESNKKMKPVGSFLFRWLVGALIIGLVAILFLLLNKDEKDKPIPSQQELVPKRNKVPIADQPRKGEKKSIQLDKEIKQETQHGKNDKVDFIALVEDSYRVPEDIFGSPRSGDLTMDTISLAIQYFVNSDYQKAIDLVSIYRANHSLLKDNLMQEVLAHAYLKQHRFAKAASIFESIVANNQLVDDDEWYLLLSLIGDYKNHPDRAEKLLKKISHDDLHSHQKDALELSKKLKALNK